jgi:hypothetical protein
MKISRRPRRTWSHQAASLPPSENRLREQRRFKVMFAFFSNRLGCIGSLIVSILGSLVLILILRGCGAF